MILGGGQERNKRAGTENVYGIVGFAKALELAMERFEIDRHQINSLKNYMFRQLINNLDDVSFNGDVGINSLYTVLSVSLLKTEKSHMLLQHLNEKGICVSGGSACSAGGASHVINALGADDDRMTIRFSFSRYNTRTEVDQVVAVLQQFLQTENETVLNKSI